MGKIITNESFLNEVLDLINPNIELRGNYIKSTEKILCKCKICGHEWGMLPGNIKKGKGCPKCSPKSAGNMKKKKAEKKLFSFVEKECKFTIIGSYKGSRSPIDCKCNICGHIWSPLPSNILKGLGCPKCGRKACSEKLITDRKKIAQSLPENIELLTYTRSGEPALFKCKQCSHEWFSIPSRIISRHSGCPICNHHFKNHEIFILLLAKINENVEVLETYINAVTKLLCRCKKCGCLWKTDPHHLLSGKGCPSCNKSKGELLIQNILNTHNIPYEYQYYLKTESSSKIFVDFMVLINNQIYFIEYNGILHYKPVEYFGGEKQYLKQCSRDNYLKKYCLEHNIILIELKYSLSKEEIENIIVDKLAVAASQRL